MKKVLGLAIVVALMGSLTAVGQVNRRAGSKKGTHAGSRPVHKAPEVPNSKLAGTDGCPGTLIAALPYADTGTTVGAGSTVDVTSGAGTNCTQWAGMVPGPDVVYSFTAGAGAQLTFSVAPSDEIYDPAIYLLTTCGTGSTCVEKADAGLSGVAETLGPISLTNGTTYYFFVDSYLSASYYPTYMAGPYNLSITGTLPAELQSFTID